MGTPLFIGPLEKAILHELRERAAAMQSLCPTRTLPALFTKDNHAHRYP